MITGFGDAPLWLSDFQKLIPGIERVIGQADGFLDQREIESRDVGSWQCGYCVQRGIQCVQEIRRAILALCSQNISRREIADGNRI
ncbi:MAG: hypothetical protein JO093_05210 [Acidobacteria bacterium]|nr:hypothetical protein [Acidobacteriota bacterium]